MGDLTPEYRLYLREELEYLKGHSFRLATFVPPTPEWDHEHCRCGLTIADSGETDSISKAYKTTRPDPQPNKQTVFRYPSGNISYLRQPAVNGELESWVCPDCFEEFRNELDFRLESE